MLHNISQNYAEYINKNYAFIKLQSCFINYFIHISIYLSEWLQE